MTIPQTFDSIRPFEPEELPAAYDRLLADPGFRAVVAYLYPDKSIAEVESRMRDCKTSLEFQKTFCYTFLQQLLEKASLGCDMDASALDVTKRYSFVSNHRDIVLDSALLDKLLIDVGFSTTCEIAIGDNLLSLPWVRDLVRVNKSFIVERNLPPRQLFMASKRLAEYMHFAIGEKNENIWIAQREGRAKDSNDRTQSAILKMMTMGGEGSMAERLIQLHIVPLAISYEYDPCDYLKAKELQQRRDIKDFQKSGADDVLSMRTGILGYKGHIHYHCADCIDDFVRSLADVPKGEFYDRVAMHIDREIHRHYRLYPVNYVALDLLEESDRFATMYTEDDKRRFQAYVEGQLAKIDLPEPDYPFLRERLLTMYGNPVRNFLQAQ